LITDNETLSRSAHSALKKIIKGKTFGELKEIKDSTVLQASKMIYDRIDPVVQHIETKNRTVIAVVDYEKYKNK